MTYPIKFHPNKAKSSTCHHPLTTVKCLRTAVTVIKIKTLLGMSHDPSRNGGEHFYRYNFLKSFLMSIKCPDKNLNF